MPETMEMQEITVDGVTKYSIMFGLTDDGGAPLLDRHGKQRFTHILADTPAELVRKLAEANQEVSRAMERTRRYAETLNRRPTQATPAAKIEAKPLTQDEQFQVGLDVQDPRKAPDAIRRVVESVVPVKEITSEVARQAQTIDMESRKRIAREFIAKNKEYLPVEANNALLNRYLIEQNLEFSVENLEFAAAAKAGDLVARPRPAPVNELPPSPLNVAPANEAPIRETPPTPTRRAPVSGIRNSEASALPTSATTMLTRQQAMDMLIKEPQKYETWMRDPQKNAILNRALAGR